jgi:hypothetical protein
MKMFTSVIFLLAGLLLTTARCSAQAKPDSVSSVRSDPGSFLRNQPRKGNAPANANHEPVSFLSFAIPEVVSRRVETPKFGSATQRVAETFGRLPLSFEANVGQTDPQVRFLSRGSGYTLFLTSGEAVLVAGKDRSQVARMELVGANPAPEVQGLDELSGRSYYFNGNDPKKWQSKVANYARVRYQAVYRGVDLVYYGNQGRLEYDFVVAPGADPKPIQLSFPEARKISIDHASGDLKLDCAGGEICFQKPEAYQIGDRKTLVDARYVLQGINQVGIALGSYDVSKPLIIDPVLSYSTYLGATTSVNEHDFAAGIAVDASGNVYVTGTSPSPTFPIVHPLPAPNNALQGATDAFVSKLSFDSKTSTLSLAYSAFLGGSGVDAGVGIAVDASGSAYVTGYTFSPNFPTVHPLPAPNSALQGSQNAFVSKLSFDNATSTLSLIYSTYLGGNDVGNDFGDYGAGIAVDPSGDACVTGVTTSPNFPVVHPLPAPNNALQGPANAFVSKLSFDRTTSTLSLAYSTYLGGNGGDEGAGIAVDASGDAYVTGTTSSQNFPIIHPLPAPNNALQDEDAFVSKLSFDRATSTLSLVYSTFLGGTFEMGSPRDGAVDEGLGIAVDSNGNAYVTGATGTPDFPVVNSESGLTGQENAFVSKLKFDSATSTLSLIYSTYLGGSNGSFETGFDRGYGIAVDSSGNAYVVGTTTSPDFPLVDPLPAPNNAFQGADDAFVTKLTFDSTTSTLSLAYSTYLGGSADSEGLGIAVDTSGNAYVIGATSSADFTTVHPLPPPNNALQGGTSAFVAKIGSNSIPAPVANAGPDTTAHVGILVTLDGSNSSDPAGSLPLTYTWSLVSKPAGSTVTLSDPSIVDPTFTPDQVGDYLVQLVVTNAAGVSSLPATVTVSTLNSPPVADAGPDQAITVLGTLVHLDGSQSFDPDGQPITYLWSILSKPVGSNATLTGPTTAKPSFIADVHGDYTIQLIVTDSLGTASKPAMVKVSFGNVAPVADAGRSESVVVGETVTLNGSGSSDANRDPLTYKWSVVSAPRRSRAVISNPTAEIASFVPDLPGTFVVQLIVNDGLVDSSPATVEIEAVQPRTELAREIRGLQRVIEALPPKAFKHAKLQNALLNKLNAVIRSIRERRYFHALQQLQNDILEKTNGCAISGAPDQKDWIVNCPDQSKVYTPLLNIIAEIKALRGG